jgi:ankyrin repeat protein
MGKFLNAIKKFFNFFCIRKNNNHESKLQLEELAAPYKVNKKKLNWDDVLKNNNKFCVALCISPVLLDQLSVKDKHGMTIWHIAIKHRAKALLESLTKYKNIPKLHIDTLNKNGETPFVSAMLYLDDYDSFEFLPMLMKAGATPSSSKIKRKKNDFTLHDIYREKDRILQEDESSYLIESSGDKHDYSDELD